jgi:PPIC-type PPIASE domain
MSDSSNNSNRIINFILILLILTLPTGCKQKEETKNSQEVSRETFSSPTQAENTTTPEGVSNGKKILATVNGQPIYQGDLNGRELQDVIVDEILYEEGIRQGLDKKLNIKDKSKRGLIVETLKQEIVNNMPEQPAPTNEEIEDYYKKHENKYVHLKVIGISLNDKRIAHQVREKALKGMDFNKIASDYPDYTVKRIETPFFLTTDMNDHFNSFEIGTVSEIIRDSGNFTIYKVVNLYRFSLSSVKPPIMYAIQAKKRDQAVKEFAEKARKENHIKVVIIKDKA